MPLLQPQTYSMKSQVLHMSFSPSCLPKNHDILKKFGVFRFGLYCIVLPSRSQGDLFKCSILNACSGVVQNRRKVCNLSWHCRIMFAQKPFQGQIWGRSDCLETSISLLGLVTKVKDWRCWQHPRSSCGYRIAGVRSLELLWLEILPSLPPFMTSEAETGTELTSRSIKHQRGL